MGTKIILMHGKDATPESKWYPWFKSVMEEGGYECLVPELPKTNNPVLEEWIDELCACNPDNQTILIGHSRGGVAVLRFLERVSAEFRVKGVILIATNESQKSQMTVPGEESNGFYTKDEYNFEKIKSHSGHFVVLHSKDDQWVPYKAGERISEGLNVDLLSFDDKGHFGRGVDEVPELIEIIRSWN